MTTIINMHAVAALALDRMFYCLLAGSILAGLLQLLVGLAPQSNSRTRFAMRFALLAALAAFSIVGTPAAIAAGPAHGALFTVPESWADVVVWAWAALASLGLIRIAIGLWQVHRLRRSCVVVDHQTLEPDLQAALATFSKVRRVSLLASPRAPVPAAIGFFRPAVVVPAWLLEKSAAGELKYVLLHELAHLRRWDDWTNLLQKIVRAVLFFHPAVWWIERDLTLDREMACDDAVLAESPGARAYAECLASVAEKNFLRRRLAMAQAAVHRMKHLTLRVARILDERSPKTTRLWKPAVPLVTVAVGLCAFWTSQAPPLISVGNPASAAASRTARDLGRTSGSQSDYAEVAQAGARQQLASLTTAATQPAMHPQRRRWSRSREGAANALSLTTANQCLNPRRIAAQGRDSITPGEPGEVVVLFVRTRFVAQPNRSAAPEYWQVSTVEVRWIAPVAHARKESPKKI